MVTEIASLKATLALDDSDFTRGLTNADANLSNFGQNAEASTSRLQSLGNSFSSTGAKISELGVVMSALSLPIIGIGAQALNVAGQFDASMTEIAARTGLASQEIDRIADFALDMGSATVFSGQQAADAFLDLLTSGQTTEEAFATLPQVMSLAAAGGLELGQSADTLTDIMAQFGLTVSDTVGELEAAEYVANQLAAASQVSSASVGMLSQAFANVGGIASGFGLDVQETSAALAILAENGIKGAEAGTNLKSMLLNMSSSSTKAGDALEDLDVSLYDVNGNMRPLTSIIEDLRERMEGMSDVELNSYIQDLAGSYGQAGLRALLFGGDLETTKARMEESATASQVAQEMMDSWSQSVNSLFGSIEGLMTRGMLPFMNEVLKPIVKQLTEAINRFTEWTEANPELRNQIIKLATAFVALGPSLFGAGKLITFVGAAIGTIASPLGIATIAIAAFAAAWRSDFGGIRSFIENQIAPAFKLLFSFLTGGAEAESGLRYASQGFRQIAEAVNIVKRAFANLGEAVSPIFRAITNVVKRASEAIFGSLNFGDSDGALGFQLILSTAQMLAGAINNFLVPAIDWLVDSFVVLSNVGAAALAPIVQWFENLIGFFKFGGASGAGLWFQISIVTPLLEGFESLVTGGEVWEQAKAVGASIFNAIGEGIVNIATWLYTHVIEPIGTALVEYVTSGTLREHLHALGGMFLDAIAWGITATVNFSTWLYDSLIAPIRSTTAGFVDSGGLRSTMESLGTMFLDAIAWGVTATWTITAWLWDVVISPMIAAVASYGTSGQLWEHVKGLGKLIMDGIAVGITFIATINQWFYGNVIAPLIEAVLDYVLGGTLVDHLMQLGSMFLTAIATGITWYVNWFTWLQESLILPMVSEIVSYIGSGELWEAMKNLGSDFLVGLAEGLGNMGTWVHEHIIQPIIDAVSQLDIGAMLGGIGDWLGIGGNTTGGMSYNYRADGGPVNARSPYIVGERGPELFIPATSGTIMSNESMGGVSIQSVTINTSSGDGREIARAFELELRELMRRRG